MSPPTNVEFAYSIPLESILFHYGFRISVGRRSIIASRKRGWSPREWEAVVVLVQSAELTEWQEKPRDRQFAGLWGGHRHLRKDEDKRSHWAQESRLAFLCVFFFLVWKEDVDHRKVTIYAKMLRINNLHELNWSFCKSPVFSLEYFLSLHID